MKNDINFKYYFLGEGGNYIPIIYPLDAIEDFKYNTGLGMEGYEVVAKCLGTGCSDRNNKEIFVNDLVRFKANYLSDREKASGFLIGLMVKIGFQFMLRVGKYYYVIDEETEGFSYTAEICGNLFENPECMEALFPDDKTLDLIKTHNQ